MSPTVVALVLAGTTVLLGAVMLLFLFRITGIPYTKRQALRSGGDAYREYQRTTSIFLPLPTRRAAAPGDAR